MSDSFHSCDDFLYQDIIASLIQYLILIELAVESPASLGHYST
jgi:hypothetical protein